MSNTKSHNERQGGGVNHQERILEYGEEAELDSGVRVTRSDDGDGFMLEREPRDSEKGDTDYVVLSRIEVAALAEMAGYDPKEVSAEDE